MVRVIVGYVNLKLVFKSVIRCAQLHFMIVC